MKRRIIFSSFTRNMLTHRVTKWDVIKNVYSLLIWMWCNASESPIDKLKQIAIVWEPSRKRKWTFSHCIRTQIKLHIFNTNLIQLSCCWQKCAKSILQNSPQNWNEKTSHFNRSNWIGRRRVVSKIGFWKLNLHNNKFYCQII